MQRINLRKEIETLFLWYLPMFIISYISTFTFGAIVKSMNGDPVLNTSVMMALSTLTAGLDNIVIFIWLFLLTKKLNQKYILWALFGLITNYFAVIIFILLYLYENHYSNNLRKVEN